MRQPAIRAEQLRKEFRLGSAAPGGLRDVLRAAARWPLDRLARRPRPAPRTIAALADVSFEVDHGEVVGVIGRNGAGKSTLLKILTRIVEPTSGTATVFGRVGSLLEVGTGFHPELTGRENVFLNGAILGMSRAEVRRKFDEIVAFAGVDDFLDTQVKFYSSGMYLRLAFSVAAHLEPEVLLVDEVLAVGDLEFQRKCLKKMDDVSHGGRAVLLVSHQLNAIRSLCARTLWLDGGRLRAFGPTAEVVGAYESATLSGELGQGQATTHFEGWHVVDVEGRRGHLITDVLAPVTFEFLLRAPTATPGAAVSLALTDDRGEVLWSADPSLPALDAGAQALAVRLPALPLRSGAYRWRVKLYAERRLIDDWYAIPPLVISSPRASHSRDAYMGVLNLPCSLEVTPLGTGWPSAPGDPPGAPS